VYSRLGLRNSRHLLLTVLEAQSLRSGCQEGGVLGRTVFLACRPCLPSVSSHSRERVSSGVSVSRESIMGPSLMTSPAPITSPRPHLQIPSHWGLGLRHRNLDLGGGGHRHSVHSSLIDVASIQGGPVWRNRPPLGTRPLSAILPFWECLRCQHTTWVCLWTEFSHSFFSWS